MVPIFFQRDQLYLYNLKDVLNSLRFYIKLDSLLEIYKIIEKNHIRLYRHYEYNYNGKKPKFLKEGNYKL